MDTEIDAETRQLQEQIFGIQLFEDYSRAGVLVAQEHKRKYSLNDLMNLPVEEYATCVFSLAQNGNQAVRYISVRVSTLSLFENEFKVINLMDQTTSIMFDISKGEKKILQLINACVSHQLRNPINSIIATNLKLQQEANRLKELLSELELEESMKE